MPGTTYKPRSFIRCAFFNGPVLRIKFEKLYVKRGGECQLQRIK